MSECTIRDTWGTPPEFRLALYRTFGQFQIDVCADAENTLAAHYYDGADANSDGLKKPWRVHPQHAQNKHFAFCNPPGTQVGHWSAKALEESRLLRASVVLTQAGIETRWYADVRYYCETLLLEPRVHFIPPPGIKESSNARNYMLLVFHPWLMRAPVESMRIWNWYSILTKKEIEYFNATRLRRRKGLCEPAERFRIPDSMSMEWDPRW